MLRFICLLSIIGLSLGCKYYCNDPKDDTYFCCDDERTSEEDVARAIDIEESRKVNEDEVEVPKKPGCYYYCAYKNSAYCCAYEGTKIPASHAAHDGLCPEIEETVCKKGTELFLRPDNGRKLSKISKSVGLKLASDFTTMDMCASDGYCESHEKCCPNVCAKKQYCIEAVEEQKNKNKKKNKFYHF